MCATAGGSTMSAANGGLPPSAAAVGKPWTVLAPVDQNRTGELIRLQCMELLIYTYVDKGRG